MDYFPNIYSRNYFFNNPLIFPNYHSLPQNYVHWSQTPESHIFSADLPGVEKENIRVEVEDSIYCIIRTEDGIEESRRFMRKFRLPALVDVDGISAGYSDGVLTVTVPRFSLRMRRGLTVDPSDIVSFGASAA